MTKTILKSKADRDDQTERATADPKASVVLNIEQGCEATCQESQPPADNGEEAIRALAHHKWKVAGCPPGDGVEFWLDAEREVHTERSGPCSVED